MRQFCSICVVIPAYNEESILPQTVESILVQLDSLTENSTLLIVDDGSSDGTLEILKKLSAEDSRVSFISFTRNFGHQIALRAGIDAASEHDIVITMDADMQHPPSVIPEMVEKWKQGADVVYGLRKAQTSTSPGKSSTSIFYNWFLKSLSDYPLVEGAADFRLLDRKILTLIKKMDSEAVFLRGLIPWFGFSSASVFYDESEREDGSTRYSLGKMIQLAVLGMMSVSAKPLRLVFGIGISISSLAFIYGLYAIFIRLFTDAAVQGWTSILVSVLFIGGLQLAAIGILGEYLAKIFLGTLDRPTYVIKEKKLQGVELSQDSQKIGIAK